MTVEINRNVLPEISLGKTSLKQRQECPTYCNIDRILFNKKLSTLSYSWDQQKRRTRNFLRENLIKTKIRMPNVSQYRYNFIRYKTEYVISVIFEGSDRWRQSQHITTEDLCKQLDSLHNATMLLYSLWTIWCFNASGVSNACATNAFNK